MLLDPGNTWLAGFVGIEAACGAVGLVAGYVVGPTGVVGVGDLPRPSWEIFGKQS